MIINACTAPTEYKLCFIFGIPMVFLIAKICTILECCALPHLPPGCSFFSSSNLYSTFLNFSCLLPTCHREVVWLPCHLSKVVDLSFDSKETTLFSEDKLTTSFPPPLFPSFLYLLILSYVSDTVSHAKKYASQIWNMGSAPQELTVLLGR